MHAVHCVDENRMRTVQGSRALGALRATRSVFAFRLTSAAFQDTMVVGLGALSVSGLASECNAGSKHLDVLYNLFAILPVFTDRHSG